MASGQVGDCAGVAGRVVLAYEPFGGGDTGVAGKLAFGQARACRSLPGGHEAAFPGARHVLGQGGQG